MSQLPASRPVRVANRQGLHARAVVLLAELSRRFQARIELVASDRRRATTTEVLQMLTLGCEQGEELELEATGPDAEAALEAMAELFANKFGEDTEDENR